MYMYEIMEMKVEGLKTYFSSPWNYLDQLAPVLFGMYFYKNECYGCTFKHHNIEYRIESNWQGFYICLIFVMMYLKLSWF